MILNFEEDVAALSDQELLRHVLTNIISNSIKYRSGDNPKIEMSAKLRDSEVAIRISDNGVGMSEEESASAFDRFYQNSTSMEGIGLGLYLSRAIVAQLSGTIRITSDGKGKGTTVIVTLPARDLP